MGNNSHTGCLMLVPGLSNEKVPEIMPLLDYLQHSGFISTSLMEQGTPHSFLVGDAFLQILTFMGCSPHINLEPTTEDKKFCYVRIDGPWPLPELRYGQNTQMPRCCACKGRVMTTSLPEHSWHQWLPSWLADPYSYSITCTRCGQRQRPLDLNWRREAAFGHLFIVVENIFPGEAIPIPAFLAGLHNTTGVFWQYFYVTALNKC